LQAKGTWRERPADEKRRNRETSAEASSASRASGGKERQRMAGGDPCQQRGVMSGVEPLLSCSLAGERFANTGSTARLPRTSLPQETAKLMQAHQGRPAAMGYDARSCPALELHGFRKEAL
jgi:hypothetical protein